MIKIKALARMYVWWPGINADIEKSVWLCTECQEVQSSPPVVPLNPWKWSSRPWALLHLDFAGPFLGKMFLIAIDAHSKWIEAACTTTTSLKVVIEELRTIFAKFGIPETIVTDNGTGFVSQEFESLLNQTCHFCPVSPSLEWVSRTRYPNREKRFEEGDSWKHLYSTS